MLPLPLQFALSLQMVTLHAWQHLKVTWAWAHTM